MDTCHYNLSKHIEYITPSVNLNVNGGLWVIIMCQGRFLPNNKYTALRVDVENKGGYACVGTRGK